MKQFTREIIETREAQLALEIACKQVEINLPLYKDCCQNNSSIQGIYPSCANVQWTCGFWPGEIWLAYEATGKELFRQAGLRMVESFWQRICNRIEVDHHDMGFLYTPSCVAAYKLVGSEQAKIAAVMAADVLLERFQEKGKFIQAWGPMGQVENYRFIIDCLLNLPLLYWASEVTGKISYQEVAYQHIQTCLQYSFRPDGSTHHTFFMNPQTGEPSHGATCQGYSNDSSWARGQAWGIYGTALSYRYTKNPAYLESFQRGLDYYLSRLPEDMVPYWDMIFISGNEQPRDSSSASIVACGLLEMAKYVEEETKSYYYQLAGQMLKSLFDHYAVLQGVPGNGLVLHGTYSKKTPYNTCTQEGEDECVSWGDYFYMEALTRYTKEWEMYW